MFVVEGLN